MSRTPAVTIELRRLKPEVAELVFRRATSKAALPLRIAKLDERISSIRRDLPYLLHRFHQLVGSEDIDLEDGRMKTAVFELRGIAYYIIDIIVRGTGFTASDFARALADYLYPALLSRTDDHAPLIEFIAAEGDYVATQLPVELLPLPNIRESEITSFLGFQAVVVRRRASISRLPSSQAQPIPTQFFAHSSLPGVVRQRNYFSRTPALALAPAWPVPGLGGGRVAITGLARTLSRLLHDRVPGSRKIAHFHCHFSPGGVDPAGGFATVAQLDFGNQVTVPVPMLVGMLAQTLPRRNNWSGEILVFLNACQTAAAGGIGGNLVEHLLAAGFRHIIGSETLIPDRLAARFAEIVYEGLLTGETLGMAVHLARRGLIEVHGNPGGVLWTIIGDPDLRLR